MANDIAERFRGFDHSAPGHLGNKNAVVGAVIQDGRDYGLRNAGFRGDIF